MTCDFSNHQEIARLRKLKASKFEVYYQEPQVEDIIGAKQYPHLVQSPESLQTLA